MGLVKGFKNLFFGEEEEADQPDFDPDFSMPKGKRSSSGKDDIFDHESELNGFKVNTGSKNSGNEKNSVFTEGYDDVFSKPYTSGEPSFTGRPAQEKTYEEEHTMGFEQTTTLQIVLARPIDFSEVRSIGDDINAYKTVILNLEMVKSDDAKRILDFLSGVAYANKAQIKMMAQKTFAIMSKNVKFDGKDLLTELENNGYSF